MMPTPATGVKSHTVEHAPDEHPHQSSHPFTYPTRLGAAAYDQNHILKSLRKVEQGLRARLLSIAHDACIALQIYQSLFPDEHIPLFANARAGSWYVPPLLRGQCPTYTAAFKSADGHYGQWSSSLRRPNMHVLQAALDSGAVVIVDVTRRGKRFPDSFMKTIPIWCAVMNNIAGLYSCTLCQDAQSLCEDCGRIHVHPDVPESERVHIQSRLPEWLKHWRRSIHTLQSAVPVLHNSNKRRHAKPLRPIWISPQSSLWQHGVPLHELEFTPIVCVSASKVVPDGERSFIEPLLNHHKVCGVDFPPRPVGFAYVQGAGDDEEAWCCGLSPLLFWVHFERLLTVAYGEGQPGSAMHIEDKIKKEIACVISEANTVSQPSYHLRNEPQGHDIGRSIWSSRIMLRRTSLQDLPHLLRLASAQGLHVIVMGASSDMVRKNNEDSKSQTALTSGEVDWMPLVDRKGKIDFKYAFGRALGPCLSRLQEFCLEKEKNVLVCSTDKKGDWCAGLAIAWLAWHCKSTRGDQDGEQSKLAHQAGYSVSFPRKERIGYIDKERIHSIMLHFMSSFPEFELSRATLKQLNRFFSSPFPSSSLVTVNTDK